jgi:16S rRNA processing protein RimM
MNQFFKIGKLVATFGTEGQMLLEHNLGKRTSLKGIENLFIEEDNESFLPYFVASVKIKNDSEVYLTFEGINTKESAKRFIRKEIWIGEDDFKKFSSRSAPISFLGFVVVSDNKELGEVCEVIEQPHQLLCKIMISGKEVLLPVHEGTLQKIDKKNRKLFLSLPDGLLELYIET